MSNSETNLPEGGSDVPMKVTVEEIAKMAGVSKATVSRVLNRSVKGVSDQTRQRIQKILDEVNYSHDSVGTAMRSRVVALVVPAAPHNLARDFGEGFCSRIKFDKRRNTLCISSFSNCNIGAKDPPKAEDIIVRCCPN